jgi:hypothetical protein
MIEISITEIALFIWAILATAQAFKYRDESRKSAFVLKLMLTEDGIRDDMVKDYKHFKEANK